MAASRVLGVLPFYLGDGLECPFKVSNFSGVPPPSSCSVAVSMDAPPEGYRKNVGICLLGPSKKIFTASRIYIPNTWQMPQGGADDGEDLRTAAMRELREETGVTSAEFIAEVPYWMTYDFPLQIKRKLNRRWGTNYKGQAQKWFLFKFTGKEDEINLSGDGSEKPEFKEWSWKLPEQVLDLAIDFKKPVYEQVLRVFVPYLSADVDSKMRSGENLVCMRLESEKANLEKNLLTPTVF